MKAVLLDSDIILDAMTDRKPFSLLLSLPGTLKTTEKAT